MAYARLQPVGVILLCPLTRNLLRFMPLRSVRIPITGLVYGPGDWSQLRSGSHAPTGPCPASQHPAQVLAYPATSWFRSWLRAFACGARLCASATLRQLRCSRACSKVAEAQQAPHSQRAAQFSLAGCSFLAAFVLRLRPPHRPRLHTTAEQAKREPTHPPRFCCSPDSRPSRCSGRCHMCFVQSGADTAYCSTRSALPPFACPGPRCHMCFARRVVQPCWVAVVFPYCSTRSALPPPDAC